MTKQTRDGGSDIIAVRSDMGAHIQMLIEAKRYGSDKTTACGYSMKDYDKLHPSAKNEELWQRHVESLSVRFSDDFEN